MKEKKVDLVLLDVMLPVINGWEVCRMIKRKSPVPVIMLTARDMLEDKIQGFDSGARNIIPLCRHNRQKEKNIGERRIL
jgi:DNA-binding response OmpR family regulator